LIGTIVDTKELWETVVASLVAGVGITASFSVMIFSLARLADLRRSDRPLLAAGAGGMAALALIVTAGGIILGMVVMLSK
jgi:hypothetical protein